MLDQFTYSWEQPHAVVGEESDHEGAADNEGLSVDCSPHSLFLCIFQGEEGEAVPTKLDRATESPEKSHSATLLFWVALMMCYN